MVPRIPPMPVFRPFLPNTRRPKASPFPEISERGGNLCGASKGKRGLCGFDGLRFARSSGFAAGNVPVYRWGIRFGSYKKGNEERGTPYPFFFARMFYRIMNKISKTEIVDGARDYRLMSRQVVDSILAMAEYNRFTKGIFGWVGYETKWLEYENIERKKGETKWSFWKLFLYSLDGITAFSTVPLAIASFMGVLFCVLAFLMIAFVIVRKLILGIRLQDGLLWYVSFFFAAGCSCLS